MYESLIEVSKKIGKCMSSGTLVSVESTVAPGTTENVVKPILEESSSMKAGRDFFLAFCYERVMVGRLIKNIVDLPRIVGGKNKKKATREKEFYKKITREKKISTKIYPAQVAKK